MAAAEYYNVGAPTAPQYPPYQQSPHQQSPHQQSPYQQSPSQRPHELHGSPVPPYSLPARPQALQQTPPPSYYNQSQGEHRPSVHFAPSSGPPQQHRPSFSSSGRPSFSNNSPPKHGQYLQPPPHNRPAPQQNSQLVAAQPPHMRPYMNGNQSEHSLGGGYTSDPESGRRRRHRRHEHKDDEATSRDMRPRKDRSRSTNADKFLGAAGGGLIGDLIFPGLGTVGGAVAGWIGGKEYGSHRKIKEERRHQDQVEWEHRFRSRSNSSDRRHEHKHGHHQHHKSPVRHKSDY